MQPWRRSAPDPSTRPGAGAGGARPAAPVVTQITRSFGLTLQRIGARISGAPAAPPIASGSDGENAGLVRARAALAHARQQMPGLLGTLPAATADSSAPAIRPAEPQNESIAVVDGAAQLFERDMRLARVEEVILQLEEERRQLRSEVATLRLLADDLRETLVRLDERGSPGPTELGAAPWDRRPLTEPLYPAGSIGVELRLSAIHHAGEVEGIRAAVASRPEVDSVRVIRSKKRKARLRVCLRLPTPRRPFLNLIRSAAPAAILVPGSSRGTVSLRLHPS